MAYNPIYPTTYQPIGYYPQTQTSMPQTQQSNSGIIWVTGEAGAKSFLVAPNTTVQLWDSENPVIYLKSADASGMPSIKVIDYTIRNAQNDVKKTPLENETKEYATKEDMAALKAELMRKIDDIKGDLGA